MRRRGIRRLLRDRAGIAAVEAALATGIILIPLTLGVIAYGAVLANEARLDRALQSATYYVWNNMSGFTTAGITTAANAGFGSAAPTPTVTTSTTCKCVSSGYNPVSTVACTGTCSSGQTLASYLTITITASFTLPVTVSYLASPLSQSVSGTIRTQ
jgi:Flp pilus assembly protein TadG